ncbi:MAG: hypothetical protein R2827_06330 [Bdellovibrionales bacterium]
MNGLDFGVQIKGMFPDMKFILATGHADKQVAIEAVNQGIDATQLSFNMEYLIELVKEILDAKLYDIESEHEEMEELINCYIESPRIYWKICPILFCKLKAKATIRF